ncbi:GM17652 [Drosophila sechellia]|uniref:GM17652 n=1 Tax=Drosophila sechellia TaxID=7238 RepID=B4IG98_DROSE|nr:GM17652 [Drosophila sechellia]
MDIDGLQMSLPAMKHEAEEQHPSTTEAATVASSSQRFSSRPMVRLPLKETGFKALPSTVSWQMDREWRSFREEDKFSEPRSGGQWGNPVDLSH